jgi:hypothetical protein
MQVVAPSCAHPDLTGRCAKGNRDGKHADQQVCGVRLG